MGTTTLKETITTAIGCLIIGEVMVDYGKLFPYLERDYPNRIENNSGVRLY